jgi:5-methylcytosine-specific restriction endonuclease McrA
MPDFSQAQILDIWEKAKPIEGKNPKQIRKDKFGKEIAFDAYGLESPKGWNVHHIVPLEKGGKNDISNLEPLHWKNHKCLHQN